MNKGNLSKHTIGILYGGQSAEHDVSVQSAINIFQTLDTSKFEPIPIYIDKQGIWHLKEAIDTDSADAEPVMVSPGVAGQLHTARSTKKIDCMFPVLHGPRGEDGTVQGLLELLDVPYVGSGVLGSAIGMDKDIMKRLLCDANIPVTPFKMLLANESYDANDICQTFGLPLFVKPANMGSSIGVSKVSSIQELTQSITNAFLYDHKIIIEQAVEGDEVECSVLGNEQPKASIPGRIIPKEDFYTFNAKYGSDETIFEIPAKLSQDLIQKIQAIALQTYRLLNCKGLARVDMFVRKDGQVLVNEINTMPGFTGSSVYPMLWKASGLDQTELLSQLITLAQDRHRDKPAR